MRGRAQKATSEVVKLYTGLSPVARRAVWVLLAFEAVLIAAAERDIQRHPADRIRGPKLLWARGRNAERGRARGLFRPRTQGSAMSSTTVGQVIVLVLVLVLAAAFSTAWVIRDASARGIPRRKALTWAALQWIEFPLFLWLYTRARPKRTRRPKGGPPAV